EFFSTNEVAQTLGISPFTIRRYIRLRKLKAVKLEGSYRVRQADLEHFLKDRELETEEELAALDAEQGVEKEETALVQKRPGTPPKLGADKQRRVRESPSVVKSSRASAGSKRTPKNTRAKSSKKET
ncbi:MAG: helix-turn-helix domain-containing protein, partial [Acidobacteriota bacterium]